MTREEKARFEKFLTRLGIDPKGDWQAGVREIIKDKKPSIDLDELWKPKTERTRP